MYSVNRQGDKIQPWCTWCPSLEPLHYSMASSSCCFLTWIQVSKKAGKVLWYSHLFKNFPQFVVIHTVSEAGVDYFLFPCFFYDPEDVGNLISGSSASSKSSLSIWKFSVHILLKPSLENFEHYFASTASLPTKLVEVMEFQLSYFKS